MKTRKISASLILASGSPRRKELLIQMGLPFIVKKPDIEEKKGANESPVQYVRRLSLEKAERVGLTLAKQGRFIIIAADTIVVSPQGTQVLEKPTDHRDALRMLKSLSGKTHTVHTGYCILEFKSGVLSRKVRKVITTKVKMKKLSPKLIESYIATGESWDKAGAYAAQGFGMALVEEVKGSYTNVVGLPVSHLVSDLDQHFGIPIFG